MTTNLGNLSSTSSYDGNTTIYVGDGAGLGISHIGSIFYHLSPLIFTLKMLLLFLGQIKISY